MSGEFGDLILRLKAGEAKYRRLIESASRSPKTNTWVRRRFLRHRSHLHATDATYASAGIEIGQRAWLAWTLLRWEIELSIAQMRDANDRAILIARNQSKFSSSAVPSIEWLMAEPGSEAGDTIRYENVLRWALRPDLYSFRSRDSQQQEFKRLRADRKANPQLTTREFSFTATGNPGVPLQTGHDETAVEVRVNGFPDEPLYTLFIGGSAAADLDNWPKAWRRPNCEQGSEGQPEKATPK